MSRSSKKALSRASIRPRQDRRGQKCPGLFLLTSDANALARARAKGRARGERAGAHAEPRPERRRDVAEELTAAGTVTVVRSGGGNIGAHPLTASFAKRINTLHGEAGQVLHFSSSKAARSAKSKQDRNSDQRSAVAEEITEPLAAHPLRASERKKVRGREDRGSASDGTRGDSAHDGADSAARRLWCQAKRLQDIVVRFLEQCTANSGSAPGIACNCGWTGTEAARW